MKRILDKIVEAKKAEVEELKSLLDQEWYRSFSSAFNRKCHSLKASLLKTGSTGIIAEFKRRSPSKGWFTKKDTPARAVVMCYEQHGAAGASVLTDEQFFGGSCPDLVDCRLHTQLPLLRKDFIIDEIQVQQSKAYGADVILLIAAILSPKRVEQLAAEAKRYGLEVLLELHEERELGHLCNGIDMVGINNRNLQTFGVDINNSIRLSGSLPANMVKVAESGIDDVETIRRFRDAGFSGFLIGERFMKQPDPGIAFEELIQKLKRV